MPRFTAYLSNCDNTISYQTISITMHGKNSPQNNFTVVRDDRKIKAHGSVRNAFDT